MLFEIRFPPRPFLFIFDRRISLAEYTSDVKSIRKQEIESALHANGKHTVEMRVEIFLRWIAQIPVIIFQHNIFFGICFGYYSPRGSCKLIGKSACRRRSCGRRFERTVGFGAHSVESSGQLTVD